MGVEVGHRCALEVPVSDVSSRARDATWPESHNARKPEGHTLTLTPITIDAENHIETRIWIN
jgi:hypothetical protein